MSHQSNSHFDTNFLAQFNIFRAWKQECVCVCVCTRVQGGNPMCLIGDVAVQVTKFQLHNYRKDESHYIDPY